MQDRAKLKLFLETIVPLIEKQIERPSELS